MDNYIMKRRSALTIAACFIAVLLGGCKVDVNSLASSSRADSESSMAVSDTDSHSDVFYQIDTDTDSDAESDSKIESEAQTDSDVQAFDESKYLTMFISGAAKIPLTADALYGSEQIAELNCGDRVSIVRRDVMEYCFVYSAALSQFGYVRSEYLADYLEETTVGDVYYVKPAQAQVYSDVQFTEILETVSMNDMLTVIVKRTDGKWRVADKNGKIGYIDKGLLSEKKVKNESSKTVSSKAESKKAESKKTDSSKPESSKSDSSAVSSQAASSAASSEEEIVSGLYSGKGDAPENYSSYICDVDVGYLSLRAAPSANGKVIGEIYLGESIYVIDTSGDYWYVYVPKLGMYGYVTGNINYLYPEYYDE